MRLTHINEKGTLMFVKVPEDGNPFSTGISAKNPLPESFKFIALSTEITEEEWRTIIPSQNYYIQGFSDEVFDDLIIDDLEHNSATECAKSLMQHLDLHEVNPYGENNPCEYMGKGPFSKKRKELSDKWLKAQQRTGPFAILIKEKS